MPESFEIMPGSSAKLATASVSQIGMDLQLRAEAPASIGGRYRVTFKDSHNEAEPPRSEEFTARGASAAKAEALRRSRVTEVIVDLVPLC